VQGVADGAGTSSSLADKCVGHGGLRRLVTWGMCVPVESVLGALSVVIGAECG
jgi:hypothetical protein